MTIVHNGLNASKQQKKNECFCNFSFLRRLKVSILGTVESSKLLEELFDTKVRPLSQTLGEKKILQITPYLS